MSYEVKIVYFKDLTDEEKQDVSYNGCAPEFCFYLKIFHNGKCIGFYSDAMEPEDATFCRDLSWITDALKQAYNLGLADQAA